MKIVVVGRGIAGLASAYYIKKVLPEAELTLVGLKGVSGHRASEVAQGLVCNKGLLVAFSPLFSEKLASLNAIQRFLDDLEAESGCSILRDFNGVFEPVHEDYQRRVGRIYKKRYLGLLGTTLAESCDGIGLSYPFDGCFSVPEALAALEKLLSACAKVLDAEVLSVRSSANTVKLVDGVELSFDKLVLAAGSANDELMKRSQLPFPILRKVAGQTLEMSFSKESKFMPQTSGLFSIVSNRSSARVGATSLKKDYLDAGDLVEGREQLLSKLESFHIKHLEKPIGFIDWWGIRSLTKDRMPYFGQIPDTDIQTLGGLYKSGWQLAPTMAKNLAFALKTGDPLQNHPFSIRRLVKN